MQQTLEKPVDSQHEFVSFLVGKQSFCLDISKIGEIRRWSPATILPHAPDYVLGVINLRGSVIPIFDLSAKLGFGKVEPDERSVIMIVNEGTQTIGLLVDSVSEILNVDPSRMQSKPDIDEEATDHIIGFFVEEDDIIRIIDLPMIIKPAADLSVE